MRVYQSPERKRGAVQPSAPDWFDDDQCHSPWWIEPFVEMKTMCVRNTDQCWTLAARTSGSATVEFPLLFADGKWSLDVRASRDQRCTNGSTAKTVIRTEYTMPQPAPNPIPRLTGTETFDFSGQCTGSYAYDSVLERTGD